MSQESTRRASNEVVEEILRSIDLLRFGSIEITVHDGRVTQIERREKVRFNQEPQKLKAPLSSAANN
ncbi:YezD family protein [Methylobacillus glycogenes]|uniref:YezD family protein n=1 Tax=Methylobacillus glycogenes TaxID=406 RepID=UPI0004708F40|nr:YezD family protein [Methylobacillus glycogenes]MBL8505940.1 YezD family protein [Methylobacillus glycogenes]